MHAMGLSIRQAACLGVWSDPALMIDTTAAHTHGVRMPACALPPCHAIGNTHCVHAGAVHQHGRPRMPGSVHGLHDGVGPGFWPLAHAGTCWHLSAGCWPHLAHAR